MPRKPDYEIEEEKPFSELVDINRMMKEEGLYGVAGEATLLRPKTGRALKELSRCESLDDFSALCADNRAWRIRKGATCEHEL